MSIKSKPASDAYRDNFDRIFRKSVRSVRKKILKKTCPECNGAGGHLSGHNTSDSIDCWRCAGTGKVTK